MQDNCIAEACPKRHAVYADVVARAWYDPEFKVRLFDDPRTVLTEMGLAVSPCTLINTVAEAPHIVHVLVPNAAPYGSRSVSTPLGAHHQAVVKAWDDDDYRKLLLLDPHSALRALGCAPGSDLHVEALEDTRDEVFLPIPRRPADASPLRARDIAARSFRCSDENCPLCQIRSTR